MIVDEHLSHIHITWLFSGQNSPSQSSLDPFTVTGSGNGTILGSLSGTGGAEIGALLFITQQSFDGIPHVPVTAMAFKAAK